MKNIIQKIIQIAFLALFIFLFITEKVQLWMSLLLLSVLASFVLGRFYCGWICSINTVLVAVTWIKQKLHLKSLNIPNVFLKPWVRYMAFGLFITVFIFTMVTGKKLPILPALFVISILVTFIYAEELWHRYLCPYGTLLKASTSKAKHGMQVEEDLCNNCGACRRVCPAKAVAKTETKHQILKPDCLVCMKCESSCRQSAISYK